MIIEGKQRGGAEQLADHLLRRDTNEEVIVRELHNFPMQDLNDDNLRRALMQMEAQGLAKGKKKILYHAFMALQEGECLNQKQLKHAVDAYAKNIGMDNHSRVVVEHHKDGRQHFHIVFNILNPDTGRQAKLKFTRMVEWKTGRQLEKELGLKPMIQHGRSSRQWEHQRGKHSGIDPRQVRKDLTAIYRTSKTGMEFIANLRKGGYVLTKGKNNSYVIVDKAGQIHGLMRRIEGARLKDLRQKFPDLKNIALPELATVLKNLQQPKENNAASKKSKHGMGSFSEAASLAPMMPPATASLTTTHLFRHQTAHAITRQPEPAPQRPRMAHKGGWPELSV